MARQSSEPILVVNPMALGSTLGLSNDKSEFAGDLEVVIWGFDLPVKPGTKYDGPGRTRMINFPVIMDKV